MKASEGRLLDEQDDVVSDAVCVLGEAAKIELLGYGPAVGKYIKMNDTWLRVAGVLARRFTSGSQISERTGPGSEQHRLHPLQHHTNTGSGITTT